MIIFQVGHRVDHESIFAALGLINASESILLGITISDIHKVM